MEKINIAELLKDCPKGMELDCTMYDNATFEGILDDNCFPIKIQMPEGNMHLSKYGCMSLNTHAKCVIFPKGKTTWEGFQRPFKDGDILTYNSTVGTSIFIHRNKKGEHTYKTSFYVGFNVNDRDKLLVYNKYTLIALNGDSDVRFATEEEKKQLFDAIKANGYKWNPETKTLERLTESKEDVNNEILMSGIYFDRKYHADEVELHLGNYEIEIRDGRTYAVLNSENIEQNLSYKVESKFKVGDWITNGDYTWKIISVDNFDYTLQNQWGECVEDTIVYVNDVFHLWTIKDAKNGDVLANKNGTIFINAGSSNGGGTLDCYCYLSVQNEFCIEEHKTGSWLYKNDIKPATKEQCDLLFTKMKEAGCEWDANKKELIKVE